MSCNNNKIHHGIPRVIAGATSFTPSIPKFYWDVDSQEQTIKNLCKVINTLIEYCNAIADTLNDDVIDAIEQLQKDFKDFVEHGFDYYYREQVENWFKENAFLIYQLIAKNVYFGLTDTGYFCAYVPDSWSDITFDTGQVYNTPTYGRLILRYSVEGEGVIDNTTHTDRDINDLYVNMVRVMETLYKPTSDTEPSE